jgi:hypothetical protein
MFCVQVTFWNNANPNHTESAGPLPISYAGPTVRWVVAPPMSSKFVEGVLADSRRVRGSPTESPQVRGLVGSPQTNCRDPLGVPVGHDGSQAAGARRVP